MSAKVKTRCPVCAAKYYVRTEAVGHRARCVTCQAVFRVKPHKSDRPQTHTSETKPHQKNGTAQRVEMIRFDAGHEENTNGKGHLVNEADILRWLNEGSDDRELTARPRVISDDTRTPTTTDQDTGDPVSSADSGAGTLQGMDHSLRQFDDVDDQGAAASASQGDANDSQDGIGSENLVFHTEQDSSDPPSVPQRSAIG